MVVVVVVLVVVMQGWCFQSGYLHCCVRLLTVWSSMLLRTYPRNLDNILQGSTAEASQP